MSAYAEEEPDPELVDVGEMLTDFRDQLVAADLMEAGDVGRDIVAGLLGMLRLAGEHARDVAKTLDALAEEIERMVPEREEQE